MVYHELLKPGKKITAIRYKQQLMKLNQALKKKRPEYAKHRDKLMLLHDNALPHVAEPIKNIYTRYELRSLTSLSIFTGHSAY